MTYTALYRDDRNNFQTNFGSNLKKIEDWCVSNKPQWMIVAEETTGDIVAEYKNGKFEFTAVGLSALLEYNKLIS